MGGAVREEAPEEASLIDDLNSVANLDQLNIADDEIDEDDALPEEPGAPKKFRLEQQDLFKAFVLESAAQVEQEQEAKRPKRVAKGEVDDGLSIEELMKEQGNAALNDPREYQLALFERAKEENTIAVLETGSGKTLIAVLLIRYILDQELENRSNGLPARTTFFMVPSNTLVYQQTAVLRCNLDQVIASKCGDMNTNDSTERRKWDALLMKNMVVVCTPEILHQCLRHSFITMDKINLLVFDEAHHAKKNHPYARIISDFYKPLYREAKQSKPRLFGMTASPIDAKVDLVNASRDLEQLLDCKIATYALKDEFKNKATELTLLYDTLQPPSETRLHSILYKLVGHMPIFDRYFEAALSMSSQLGPWAAEKYWEYALREEEKAKVISKLTKHHGKTLTRGVTVVDADSDVVTKAHEIVSNYHFRTPKLDKQDLSSKVIELYNFLNDHYELDLKNRCIIFVEQKATARMLVEIFQEVRPDYLRPGLLTGHAAKAGDAAVTFKQQVVTITKFRKGEINCLFATSVAEEGLDVPDCNLVIRFDLYKTVIQYVQSKGRARHKNSKFVDMVERDNPRERDTCNSVRWQEQKLGHWISNLDPGRKIAGNDEKSANDETLGRVFEHKVSGAKLTYWSALGVLSLFTSTLPVEDKHAITDPHYVMFVDGGGFVCEVVMPEHAPLRGCYGLRYPRKSLAKRSAAFEMCILLLKEKFLDSSLLSKLKRLRPEGANAHLAVSEHKTGKYMMRLKPSIWAEGRGKIPEVVYLTVIDMPDGLSRPHQPIGVITRHPLPQFPTFPLFLDSGNISNVHTFPWPSFKISEEEVSIFTKYTLLLLLHVNAKKYEENAANMSYWVVPILTSFASRIDSRNCIDWDALRFAIEGESHRWKPGMASHHLENKFIVDPWAGNRRFFSERVYPSLKPLDDIPEKTAKFDRPGANRKKNILQYSISLYGKKFEEEWPKWDKDQPVMECTQVMHRQNLLAPPSPKEEDVKARYTRAFLCPEPMILSALSTEIVTMFLVFPPIIHRIEDYLIALEAPELLGLNIGPALALEAMTKDSDNSDDHATEDRINFRPGMGNNYERLEFMGDCFLKTATSISLFVIKPHDDEFQFHVHRMHMICNQNLMNTALELNLTEFVRTMAFSRRLWYPEILQLLEGKGAGKVGGNEVFKHSLGDKSIADICEALIGAAFIQHNDNDKWEPQLWTNAIRAVTKLVRNDNHKMDAFEDYKTEYVRPDWQLKDATAAQRDLVTKIEHEQGYLFRWPRLLRCAFSHPSNPWTWEGIPSYQRLEFLGDALLDLACITHLFYNYLSKNPQWLTEHKMAMVSNKFLGAVCVKIGFHRHMRHNDPVLGGQIKEYVDEIELAEEAARGTGEVDYWIGVKDPPKCLPDIVEAYVGALFIDSDFNYSLVQQFFDMHILPFFRDMTIYDSFANNHPTTLLHTTLSKVYGCQAYQLLCENVDSSVIGGKPKVMAGVMVHRELLVNLVGESGRYAKARVSKMANEELQGMTLKEFKVKFGCDCKPLDEMEGDTADIDAPLRLVKVDDESIRDMDDEFDEEGICVEVGLME